MEKLEMVYQEKTFAFKRELTSNELKELIEKEDLYDYHSPKISKVNGMYYEYRFFKAL